MRSAAVRIKSPSLGRLSFGHHISFKHARRRSLLPCDAFSNLWFLLTDHPRNRILMDQQSRSSAAYYHRDHLAKILHSHHMPPVVVVTVKETAARPDVEDPCTRRAASQRVRPFYPTSTPDATTSFFAIHVYSLVLLDFTAYLHGVRRLGYRERVDFAST